MINVLEIIMVRFLEVISRVSAGRAPLAPRNESGFTTAELLGNAALGVVALVLIWQGMKQLGVDVMDFIEGQLTSGQ